MPAKSNPTLAVLSSASPAPIRPVTIAVLGPKLAGKSMMWKSREDSGSLWSCVKKR